MRHYGNIDYSGGQLQNAKSHTYAALPAFTVGQDEGRIIYVSTGSNLGFWVGADDGTSAWHYLPTSTVLAVYGVSGQSILNGATFSSTLTGAPAAAQKALIVKVVLSSTLAAGLIDVSIYNDAARTSLAYHRVFDLAGTLSDNIPAFFESDVSAGDLYVDITNNAGADGVFDLTITAAGVLLVQPPAPPGAGSGVNAGVAGQGISYDSINAWLDVELAGNPGLEFDGIAGAGRLRVKTDPAGGIARAAAGIQLDATVLRTTGAQDAAGLKRFTTGAAIQPAGTSGPPAAGTWTAGSFYIDVNNITWVCMLGGTPGTWEQYSGIYHRIGGAVTGSYTGTVVAGGSLTVELMAAFTVGRRGTFRRFFVWGCPPAFAIGDASVAYHIEAFPNELLEGRARLWRVSGNAKYTYLTAPAGAGSTTLTVNSTVNVTADDLVRLHQAAGPLEEYGRISSLLGGPPRVVLGETTANALAANDFVMVVAESTNLYWQNDSAVPANYQKIYLRFTNDGASNLIFGYSVMLEGLRGTAIV